MTRFTREQSPYLYIVISMVVTAVFVADLFTRLGIAVWVFYIAPVVLTFWTWRPTMPLLIGGLCTALMILGFYLSPPGFDPTMIALNRTFGGLTIWVIAATGYRFILNKIAVRRQEWIQTGQARLSEKMIGEQKLEELGENVLRSVVEHVGAEAGAFFVEEHGGFRRISTFAVPKETKVPEHFAVGDGLLGQAVKERRSFTVHEVPDGYFAIGSSLGQARPRHLLISPVLVDGKVNAVLELAYFHRVHESDAEFLRRVEESVAVAVRSAKYRQRLHELLDETQQQAGELQAQSEELRVSNEEMEEQSRFLRESQHRLEQQQAELEQTNTQLEEQAQLLQAQKDDLSKAKEALERQTRELEQASRYKSDFMANMSHELRTPLNSTLILAKLLADNREGNLSAEQINYAQTIQASGNDLLNLINDILDLAKIEAGRMDLHLEQLRLARLVQTLSRVFEPMATQKGLQFRVYVAPGTPESLQTDPQRLEQVLKNFLANAVKFTDQGEVALEISRAAGRRIAFAVRDTGIGISEDQQQIIFEPFRQADGTATRKASGTGLGLSISRELVRILGGEIHLSSELGRGSTFTVAVPEVYDPGAVSARPVAPHAVPPAAAAELQRPTARVPERVTTPPNSNSLNQNKRVQDDREQLAGSQRVLLVVEDDEAFAKILYDLAHELGFQCLMAQTAEEGLIMTAQYKPSAVLLDVGLPDNSGLSVLDRLKADSRTRHIPVHVISGSDYAETALALGAVGYMHKPVQREQVIQAVQSLESKLTQRLRRVLLVEDDAVQLESLRKLLGSREVETVAARSAAECLELLKSTKVDCMVLDLGLPDASGFSLLQTLSEGENFAFPPVIVYTGRELKPEEEEQLRKYSKSIIIKGAKSPERLLDEVTLFLHQVIAELPVEQQQMLEKAKNRDAALEGRQILIVEDDVRNIFALTSTLEPKGATIRIARNGREALTALERASQHPEEAIDLVLMDIMMPEMDGLTAMREIRKRAEWKKLPIIALTAKAMRTDQEECLEAGANDYMSKPLDVTKLLSLIRVWMPR